MLEKHEWVDYESQPEHIKKLIDNVCNSKPVKLTRKMIKKLAEQEYETSNALNDAINKGEI